MSPTARSLKLLRSWGLVPAVVECWIPGVNLRRDLFGIFDVIALNPVEGFVLGVQCTSEGNISSRVKKVQASPFIRAWLRSGCTAEVWGWGRHGGRWEVRRVEINVNDLQAVETVQLTPQRRRGGRRAIQKGLFDESGGDAT